LTRFGRPLSAGMADLSVAAASFGSSNHGTPLWSRNRKFDSVSLEIAEGIRELLVKRPDGYSEHCILQSEIEEVHNMLFAVVGSRGQAKGNYREAGFRAIFQYPRSVMILEKSWFMGLFEGMRKLPEFAAWCGPRQVAFEISEMFSELSMPVWSVDYSQFDSSIPNWLIEAAFQVLCNSSCLNSDECQVMRFLVQHFTRCDLMTPEGRMTGRVKGIPSGAVFTNMIGSIVNLLVMEMASAQFGFRIHRCLVQGDDGVFQISPHGAHPFNLEKVTDYIAETVGLTVHPDKQLVSTNEVRFLQNVHRRSYREFGLAVGVRPFMRILNGMMSYEKFRPGWSGAADSLRWIQQVEAARYHPSFPAMVEFLSEHDGKGSTTPVATLIEQAGGLEKAQGLLSSGFHMGKTPVEQLEKTVTARMLTHIAMGGDPWKFSV